MSKRTIKINNYNRANKYNIIYRKYFLKNNNLK